MHLIEKNDRFYGSHGCATQVVGQALRELPVTHMTVKGFLIEPCLCRLTFVDNIRKESYRLEMVITGTKELFRNKIKKVEYSKEARYPQNGKSNSASQITCPTNSGN